MKHRPSLLRELVRSTPLMVGLVLVWRGVWYIADEFDLVYMNGDHALSALGGIIIGLALLYFPDHDLKEIEKL